MSLVCSVTFVPQKSAKTLHYDSFPNHRKHQESTNKLILVHADNKKAMTNHYQNPD